MFRRLLIVSCALAVMVVSASAVHAQFPRGLRFPPSLQNLFLLRGETVQKELDLTKDQQTSLSDLAMQLQSDAIEILSGLQDLSPEEQKEHMPELLKMMDDKGKEVQEKVDKILDEKQRTRLKQLSLQSQGATALEDEEVIAKLKITDDQKKALIAIREEGNKQLEEMMAKRNEGGDAGDFRKKMGEMRKELGEKALAALTPAQREQFEKLKGEKFNFPQGGRGGFPGF